MSSKYVRDTVKQFITNDIPSENMIDITAQFDEINDMLEAAGVGLRDPWLGVQFIGNPEQPVTVDSTNTQGYYREVGVVFLHIVSLASLGVADSIIDRAETIRSAFRGKRLGEIVILSVGVPNFQDGSTLQFDGGYSSATIDIDYRRDFAI